jgi:hypothetical protein
MILKASTYSTPRVVATADNSRHDELTRLTMRLECLKAESEEITATLSRLQQQSDQATREREQSKKKSTQRLFAPAPGPGMSL